MNGINKEGNRFRSATNQEVSGETEYTKYINTQVSKDNEWECAGLLHKAAAKGYPEAMEEKSRVKKSEKLGQLFGAMIYAPFFGLLLTIAIVVVLMVFKIDLHIDLLILYAVVVYVLLPVIYIHNSRLDPWLQ